MWEAVEAMTVAEEAEKALPHHPGATVQLEAPHLPPALAAQAGAE